MEKGAKRRNIALSWALEQIFWIFRRRDIFYKIPASVEGSLEPKFGRKWLEEGDKRR